LFEPQLPSLWYGVDPCAGTIPEQTLDQCSHSGVTAAQYGNIPLALGGGYNAIYGGNPALEPEQSNSFTVGAILTPRNLLSGLTLSVDYWNIEINDAIDTIDPQIIVNQCGLTGDPRYCSLIQRAANGNLWSLVRERAARVISTKVNIGRFETSGVDINASYQLQVGAYGMLDFNFRGTWLEKFDQQPAPGMKSYSCAGKYGVPCSQTRPRWRHNLNVVWSTPWNLTMNAGWRFIGDVDEYELDRFSTRPQHYLDMSMEYIPTFIDFGETSLRLGVNNVLDNDPPVSGYLTGFTNGNTVPGMWDALGRYIFIGINQKF